jgi:hypothetical protein
MQGRPEIRKFPCRKNRKRTIDWRVARIARWALCVPAPCPTSPFWKGRSSPYRAFRRGFATCAAIANMTPPPWRNCGSSSAPPRNCPPCPAPAVAWRPRLFSPGREPIRAKGRSSVTVRSPRNSTRQPIFIPSSNINRNCHRPSRSDFPSTARGGTTRRWAASRRRIRSARGVSRATTGTRT